MAEQDNMLAVSGAMTIGLQAALMVAVGDLYREKGDGPWINDLQNRIAQEIGALRFGGDLKDESAELRPVALNIARVIVQNGIDKASKA